MRRRLMFRDPAPLPPDAGEWADEASREAGLAAKQRAESVMLSFDWLPEPVRHVEWVTGNPAIAAQLVRAGFDRPATAEVEVRRMLEDEAAFRQMRERMWAKPVAAKPRRRKH